MSKCSGKQMTILMCNWFHQCYQIEKLIGCGSKSLRFSRSVLVGAYKVESVGCVIVHARLNSSFHKNGLAL